MPEPKQKKQLKARGSKRYRASRALIAVGKSYPVAEAIGLLKQMPQGKFDAAVEVHCKLGVDVKQANQLVRGSTVLPHGTGKKLRVAVFCGEEKTAEAKAAGAVVVGGEELVKEVQTTGRCDFDVAVATPAMMKLLAPIAKILGQKGLMPNPKTETITEHVGEVVGKLLKGKVSFKVDDTGNVHQMIGRVSFDDAKLAENFAAFFDAVKRAKPAGAKGTYLQKVVICSSMGPAVQVAIGS